MHALAVKRYDHKVDLFISGMHDASSHAVTSSILTEKQRTAVRTAVRTSPMTVGSAVHDGLKNLSPGNHVKADRRSREAVARLVRRERTVIAEERSAGVDVNGSYGSMLEFAQQMDFGAKIRRHNDTSNSYHLDPHEAITCGYQFSKGVTFLNVTTAHLLINMARSANCGWQKQGHFDGSFNFCDKEFALIGFGLNSMGSKFNPVSINIVNSESYEALRNSYNATCTGLFRIFREMQICKDGSCKMCNMITEQIRPDSNFRKVLAETAPDSTHFQLDKPSSDNSAAFFSWSKSKFGEKVQTQICGHHAGRKYFPIFPSFSIKTDFDIGSHSLQEEIVEASR